MVELEVVDVGELHRQSQGAAAAVAEVLLLEACGDDVLKLSVGSAGGLSIKKAPGVDGKRC